MTIKTTIASALTALALIGAVSVPSNEAQARGWGGAVAAGIIGGAVLGAAVAGSAYAAPAPVYGYRRCGWVNRYDAYGYYVGKSRVCSYY